MTRYIVALSTLLFLFFGIVLMTEAQEQEFTWDGKIVPMELFDTTKWIPVASRPCKNGGHFHMHVILKNAESETAEIQMVQMVIYPTPTPHVWVLTSYMYKDADGMHLFVLKNGHYGEVPLKKEVKGLPV